MVNKTQIAKKALENVRKLMSECRLCARECGVDRLNGERGECMCGTLPVVYAAMPHHGEEPPLSGTRGSGTVFFSGCGMKCVYCQNYVFSTELRGEEVSSRRLADIMLDLESQGCHNINLVSPSSGIDVILEALTIAFSEGLNLPLVYNTGGFDTPDVLKIFEGLIDVYLPDMRYASDDMALRYSGVHNYVAINQRAVVEMYRQVGGLVLSGELAVKGLLVRLLVLPGDASGTCDSLDFAFRELGSKIGVSLMSQYYPAYKAVLFDDINRKITREEYARAVKKLESYGFEYGWVQPFGSSFDKDLLGENLAPLT
jgi:putative pyruvate formate lyase activating enzyme